MVLLAVPVNCNRGKPGGRMPRADGHVLRIAASQYVRNIIFGIALGSGLFVACTVAVHKCHADGSAVNRWPPLPPAIHIFPIEALDSMNRLAPYSLGEEQELSHREGLHLSTDNDISSPVTASFDTMQLRRTS
jgi:hypothetical protein